MEICCLQRSGSYHQRHNGEMLCTHVGANVNLCPCILAVVEVSVLEMHMYEPCVSLSSNVILQK